MVVLDILRKAFELIDEQQRVQRRDLELLPAGLAHHLVVDANQMIAHFPEFRAVAFVGAGRQAVFLDSAHPSNVVVVGAATAGARVARGTILGAVVEEGAFVEGHSRAAGWAGWEELYSLPPP
ncbi:MAG: hypothetical protein ACT4QD_13780 [Acidobacteriota bacterium]